MQRPTHGPSILFLALMYVTFISLGLPDSLLGASWPVMQPDLGVPYSYAGIASMVVAGGTIVASFFSGHLIQRLGTGTLTRVSVAMTAVALLGFSQTRSFAWLLMMAVPLGLGGGAVDAALNHFVATHYKAHHMNWLHCFWGVGAMAGPLIMAQFIADGDHWRRGYLAVSLIQGMLVAVLFASMPLWRRMEHASGTQAAANQPNQAGPSPKHGGEAPTPGASQAGTAPVQDAPGIQNVQDTHDIQVVDDVLDTRDTQDTRGTRETQTTRDTQGAHGRGSGMADIVGHLPRVWPLLLSFLLYTGIEATAGLWGSSFLVRARGFGVSEAASGVSLFYGSLTVGRIVAGFVSMKMSDARLIRLSLLIILAGAGALLIPWSHGLSLLGLAVVGLGCAPIYPAMLHQTPGRFGAELAPVLMGMQMAVAYTGSTFLPPAFGLVTAGQRLGLLPFVVLLYAAVMLGCTEMINRNGRGRRRPRPA